MTHSETVPTAFTSCLRVSRIRLAVRLGYDKVERSQVQAVEVDLTYFFPALTAVSHADKGDFICYDKVSQALAAMCEDREFRLIEYLAKEMFDTARGFAPPEVRLTLGLTKCQVPSAVVMGGASFTLSDVPPFAWIPPL